jgi:hypothetical protein
MVRNRAKLLPVAEDCYIDDKLADRLDARGVSVEDFLDSDAVADRQTGEFFDDGWCRLDTPVGRVWVADQSGFAIFTIANAAERRWWEEAACRRWEAFLTGF